MSWKEEKAFIFIHLNKQYDEDSCTIQDYRYVCVHIEKCIFLKKEKHFIFLHLNIQYDEDSCTVQDYVSVHIRKNHVAFY